MTAGQGMRSRLNGGRPCINAWSMLPCTFTTEVFAKSGWDSITFDMQHGLHDYASVVACMQALQATAVTPLVRVTWNEPGIIGRVLDGGAWGVICPMVNTQDDAAALARSCLYPPLGERSNGPIRARGYDGGPDYHRRANAEVLVLPQVETRAAVDNIEAILDVAGVSGFYVGPSDLGLSMGLAGTLDREEPEVLAIFASLIEAASRRDLIAGIHCVSPGYAARMVGMGFGMVTVSSDVAALAGAARRLVDATRQACAA